MKTRFGKGFTLIELLIVIAIIGVLAVAFLPTLLGSPSRGRDTARVADLQSIQTAILNHTFLEGGKAPNVPGAVNTIGVGVDLDKWDSSIVAELGGALPKDPTTDWDYYYLHEPTDPADPAIKYSFGLIARLEGDDNANAVCGLTGNIATAVVSMGKAAADPTPDVHCYVILVR